MCYYCRYLENEKSNSYDDEKDLADNSEYYHKRSCYLTTIIRLIIMTFVFVMFNITIVLSQSSQTQQERHRPLSNMLEKSADGKCSCFVLILKI